MTTIGLVDERLTGSVIGAFFEVYNALGHGFLEHIYKAALARELGALGHRVAREVSVTVFYKGEELATQRLDMLVDNRLIVEVKCNNERPEVGSAQLFSYLRATNLEIGLVLNFGRRASFNRVVCLNSWGGAESNCDSGAGAASDANEQGFYAHDEHGLNGLNGLNG